MEKGGTGVFFNPLHLDYFSPLNTLGDLFTPFWKRRSYPLGPSRLFWGECPHSLTRIGNHGASRSQKGVSVTLQGELWGNLGGGLGLTLFQPAGKSPRSWAQPLWPENFIPEKYRAKTPGIILVAINLGQHSHH